MTYTSAQGARVFKCSAVARSRYNHGTSEAVRDTRRRRRGLAVLTWTAAKLRFRFDRSLAMVATSLAGKLSRRSGQRQVNQVSVATEAQRSGAYSWGDAITSSLITLIGWALTSA